MDIFSGKIEVIFQEFLFTVEIDEEIFRKLVDKVMGLRNTLLERLNLLRQSKMNSCDSRVHQKDKLLKFRDSVDDLLLSLVSNTDFTALELR